jgi:hypothetical protein
VRGGVGGLSGPAMRRTVGESTLAARTAIRRWSAAAAPAAAGTVAVRGFPFAPLLEHYQAVGRHHADAGVVTDLWNLHTALESRGFRQLDEPWLLADWLPATFDHGWGTYESFLCQAMFTGLHRVRARQGCEIEDAIDTTLAACAADLVWREAAAIDGAGDERRQRGRAHAALQAMLRLAEPCAELAELDHDLEKVRVAIVAAADTPDLATVGREAALLVLDRLPALVRHVVEVTMLPVTRLHDEAMFLRCVQMFEGLYEQTARRMRRAGQALVVGDLAGAEALLVAAADRLSRAPSLYRVLTGMPREVFAVFRGLTDGRSANQSPGYRWVEQSSTPRAELSVPSRAAPVVLAGPTLYECFAGAVERFGERDLAAVAAAMGLLDELWRAMKRTHWGITLKIIGQVPGTGGTAGASYLERNAAVPLFPLLRATDTPGDGADDA